VNPYRALLSGNRNYRLLWLGQIVSQLGDWFNSVAVYALLLEMTGTATSVALMIIVQFIFIFIGAAWLHLFVYLLGGRKGYLQTLKSVTFGSTPAMLFGWIPFIGWLAGICYPALIFTTVIVGFRYVFVRVPWQKT